MSSCNEVGWRWEFVYTIVESNSTPFVISSSSRYSFLFFVNFSNSSHRLLPRVSNCQFNTSLLCLRKEIKFERTYKLTGKWLICQTNDEDRLLQCAMVKKLENKKEITKRIYGAESEIERNSISFFCVSWLSMLSILKPVSEGSRKLSWHFAALAERTMDTRRLLS